MNRCRWSWVSVCPEAAGFLDRSISPCIGGADGLGKALVLRLGPFYRDNLPRRSELCGALGPLATNRQVVLSFSAPACPSFSSHLIGIPWVCCGGTFAGTGSRILGPDAAVVLVLAMASAVQPSERPSPSLLAGSLHRVPFALVLGAAVVPWRRCSSLFVQKPSSERSTMPLSSWPPSLPVKIHRLKENAWQDPLLEPRLPKRL